MVKVSLRINIIRIIPLLLVLQSVQCSVVIDSYAQKSLYVSDYCPRMKYCDEGTHVMCMYYDPNRTYGPRCSNPRNVTITPELANQLLDIINAIRSKIANGKETGFNNTRLPRGYGIFRLKWDNELATFAQIFANQCILRHDFCRATKRFPEPGQTAGLVRFTYPGWDPISATTTTGLNDDKLSYSVAQILKSWYSQKSFVTEEMIKEYPNWEVLPNLSGRLYLEIIHGSITHMGCGMSAYTEFIYYQNRPIDGRPGGQNYNSIEIICNFSSRPKTGQKTYLTTRSKQTYNGQCGCPEGSKEDDDCLCNEISVSRENKKKGVSMGIQTEQETCTNPENNCEPTLVLLPIFTVEDAPPEKLVERARDIEEPLANYVMGRLDNKSHIMPSAKSVEVLNYFDNGEREHQPAMPHPLKTILMTNHENERLSHSPVPPISLPTLKKKVVRHRVEVHQNSEQQKEYEHDHEPEPEEHLSKPKERHINTIPKHTIKRIPKMNKSKKSSIFSRAAKFKLPNTRKNFRHYETIKTDVKPRKDFKNVQRVVDDYLKSRNKKMSFKLHDPIVNKHKEKLEKVTVPTTVKFEETTEVILSSAEEKVMDFNQYIKQKNNGSVYPNPYDLGYEDGDNKLMTLLDTLEREVKHIELDGSEKEMFHAKIRKIYDSVVGNSDVLDVSKNIPVSKSQPQLFSRKETRDSDLLDRMLNDPKAYLNKYDNNNIDQRDIMIRNEQLIDEEKNIEKKRRNYAYMELERKETKYKDGKNYPDIFENKSFNDNDLFDTDQKIFSDIERKYNDRLMHSKLDRKYDEEYPEHKYIDSKSHNTNIPAPRQENMYPKYKTILRQRANSGEERKSRNFENIREREPRLDQPREDADRNYYRTIDDDRKLIPGDIKRSKFTNNDLENPLSSERRKYYQEKLENLERKLHNSRSYRQRNRKTDARGSEGPMRRLRPNRDDADGMRRLKSKGDPFYMPDRARFLHAF